MGPYTTTYFGVGHYEGLSKKLLGDLGFECVRGAKAHLRSNPNGFPRLAKRRKQYDNNVMVVAEMVVTGMVLVLKTMARAERAEAPNNATSPPSAKAAANIAITFHPILQQQQQQQRQTRPSLCFHSTVAAAASPATAEAFFQLASLQHHRQQRTLPQQLRLNKVDNIVNQDHRHDRTKGQSAHHDDNANGDTEDENEPEDIHEFEVVLTSHRRNLVFWLIL